MDNKKDDRYYIKEALTDIDKILSYSKRADFSDIEKDGEAMDAINFRLNMLRHHIEGLSEEFSLLIAAWPLRRLSFFGTRLPMITSTLISQATKISSKKICQNSRIASQIPRLIDSIAKTIALGEEILLKKPAFEGKALDYPFNKDIMPRILVARKGIK